MQLDSVGSGYLTCCHVGVVGEAGFFLKRRITRVVRGFCVSHGHGEFDNFAFRPPVKLFADICGIFPVTVSC